MLLRELRDRYYLPPALLKQLAGRGVATVEGVMSYSRQDILSMEGVGKKSLLYLEKALAGAGYQYDERENRFGPLPTALEWTTMSRAELRWREVEALVQIAGALTKWSR